MHSFIQLLIEYNYFLKELLEEMEARTQKWFRNGSLSGSRGARKSNEFIWFWSFLVSERDPFQGPFLDPRISELFKNLEGHSGK